MDIVVLAGGLSPERDVSLSSGSKIANALLENGHRVLLLDLYLGAEQGDFAALALTKESLTRYRYQVPAHAPDLEALKKERGNGASLIGENVIELCRQADLAFLALHGDIGENGKLQAVLDAFGIAYTGSGYIGSLLAMDKDLSKQLFARHGVPTAPWQLLDTRRPDMKAVEELGFPCVVKPCSCGSSVGVSMVYNRQELKTAMEAARIYEPVLLVEPLIKGREFSVGILGGEALPVIEIIPREGFYDYRNKYQAGLTEEICPAGLDDAQTARVQELALTAHRLLRLGSYSRVDFILSEEDGEFYCLEANTLPGMTPTSLLPQEAAAAGMPYEELCDRLAREAVAEE